MDKAGLGAALGTVSAVVPVYLVHQCPPRRQSELTSTSQADTGVLSLQCWVNQAAPHLSSTAAVPSWWGAVWTETSGCKAFKLLSQTSVPRPPAPAHTGSNCN